MRKLLLNRHVRLTAVGAALFFSMVAVTLSHAAVVSEDWESLDVPVDDEVGFWPAEWVFYHDGPGDNRIRTVNQHGHSEGFTKMGLLSSPGAGGKPETWATLGDTVFTDTVITSEVGSRDQANMRVGLVARFNADANDNLSYYMARWQHDTNNDQEFELIRKTANGNESVLVNIDIDGDTMEGSYPRSLLSFSVTDIEGEAHLEATFIAPDSSGNDEYIISAVDSDPLSGGLVGVYARTVSTTARTTSFDNFQATSPEPVAATVATNGQALLDVVISANASSTSLLAANELVDYLGEITGGTFQIQVGDGSTGIAVGTAEEFPLLGLESQFAPDDPFRREEYIFLSHASGIHLVGATPDAARHAVWDMLHLLGHRQFYPTDHWEVIPSSPDITLAVDVFDRPDWYSRNIYPGGSRWIYSEPFWEKWRTRNRTNTGANFSLSTSHTYGNIISSNQAAFNAHPEYYAEVDGVREYKGANTKLCIGNADLRQLVVDHAVGVIQSDPTRDSISMDPSDGGNWCENADCTALGSVSDQVVTLANEVATAINNLGYGNKYVGIYAYADYSPPPSVTVHPNVVVSVATSFLRGGFTAKQLTSLWAAKGAMIGIREYYSITTWSGDLPNAARASSIPYLVDTVRYFYDNGARFNKANVSHSWGPCGLGYYLLAHMLWDVDATERVDELFDDFLDRAFSSVRDPIEDFYREIYRFDSTDTAYPLSEHLLGSMYRHLDDAYALADPNDTDLIERLHDLILYTRYVELYYQTNISSGSARQALGEELLRHIHAIRRQMLVVSYNGDKRRLPSFTHPTGQARIDLLDVDEWTTLEIEQMLSDGVANNELMDFEPIQFSRDLVPAMDALDLPDVGGGKLGSYAPRNRQVFYTWITEPGEFDLSVTGGLISHYQDRGNVRVALEASQDELDDGVDYDDSVPPDGQEYIITLETPHTGLHWITAKDGDDATWVYLEDPDMAYTISVELGEPFEYRGNWTMYFYVPKGTTVIGGHASSSYGQARDSGGNVVYQFSSGGSGAFSFPVPPGEDGKLWKLENCRGATRLMTVPPYLATSAAKLLLPVEVVEADAE